MPPGDNRIQIVVEAYNMAKSTLDALGKQLKAIGDESNRSGAASNNMLAGLKKNWLAISAAVAAAAVVINKAMDLMAEGAKAEQAEESFRRVAASANESADEILAAMKRASAGTVDDSDIMQKAVKGMVQGLSGDQLVKIMEAARVSARVSGQDVGQAFETITDAIANKMPRSLIQYGLVTKEQMKLINAAMAAGVSEVDLYTIAMANAADQTVAFGVLSETHAEKLQRVNAVWKEMKELVGKTFISVADFWLKLDAIIDNFSTGKWHKIVPMILGSLGSELPTDAVSGATAGARAMGRGTGNSSAKDLEAQLRARLAIRTREADINRQLAEIDIAEKDRAISKTDALEQRVALQEELLRIQEQSLAVIDKLQNPQGWITQSNAVNETRRKLLDLNLALREQSGEILPGMQEGFERYLYAAKTAFQQGIEMAQATAQAMESAFSDFFFDVMTGKLKKLGQYVTGFLQAIARAIANMLAQQAAQQILGGFFFSPTGAASAAGAGASAGITAHSGGLIMHSGGFVPRFHAGGLSSDERPAILQSGEYVVSRKGVAALDAINNGQAGGVNVMVNVENKSSQPVNARQSGAQFNAQSKSYVVGVILEDMEGNGPVRQAITSLPR